MKKSIFAAILGSVFIFAAAAKADVDVNKADAFVREVTNEGIEDIINANAPIAEERIRICHYLMEEVTKIACSLPVHTVIPFKNKPKKEYVTNIPTVAHKM